MPAQTLLMDEVCLALSHSYRWCSSSAARTRTTSLQRHRPATAPQGPAEPAKNLRGAVERVEHPSSRKRCRVVPVAKTPVCSARSALRRRGRVARTALVRATRLRVRHSTSALLALRLAEGCAPPIAIRCRNAFLRASTRIRTKRSARCAPAALQRAVRPPTKTAGRHYANGQCLDGPTVLVSDDALQTWSRRPCCCREARAGCRRAKLHHRPIR